MLEDFEDGVWPAPGWTTVNSGGSIDSSTVYEGSYSVINPDWHYNTEETVGVGDTVSMWTQPGSGRTYLGFNSSSSGTYSFVLAPTRATSTSRSAAAGATTHRTSRATRSPRGGGCGWKWRSCPRRR